MIGGMVIEIPWWVILAGILGCVVVLAAIAFFLVRRCRVEISEQDQPQVWMLIICGMSLLLGQLTIACSLAVALRTQLF